MKVQRALELGQAKLHKLSSSPTLDTLLLLGKVTGLERSQLEAYPERELTLRQNWYFRYLLRQRVQQVPVAYLLGKKDFFGLEFLVNRHVLIPRPDTEVLVTEALSYLQHNPEALVLEIGTGSGCIACAIAQNCTTCRVVAGDISESALQVATDNVKKLNLVSRVQLIKSDLLSAVPYQQAQLIVANLPYIRSADYAKLDPQIRKYEPRSALTAGADGLDYYRRLLDSLRNWPGRLLIEIADQKQAELLKSSYPDFKFREIPDLSGATRVLEIGDGS